MTFTRATLTKLRALNLPQETEDAILEIFEEAQLSKPKKKGCAEDRAVRGSRLPEDWVLPAEWREWALAVGLRPNEVSREADKFRNYWLAQPNGKGVKLAWRGTWRNWCYSTLERAGRPVLTPPGANDAGAGGASQDGPEAFTDATWRAIAKRVKGGASWRDEWGPGPDRIDCKMPVEYL